MPIFCSGKKVYWLYRHAFERATLLQSSCSRGFVGENIIAIDICDTTCFRVGFHNGYDTSHGKVAIEVHRSVSWSSGKESGEGDD